jgi:glucokinase-like ROK family protein
MAAGAVSSEALDSLVAILDLIRGGRARTRPELARASGLGRNVVAQRVAHLQTTGLVEDGELGPSTGGRAPRGLRFRAEMGRILVADIGATGMTVALSDLSGGVLDSRTRPGDVARGPEPVLAEVCAVFDELLAGAGRAEDLWGIGVGLPGPVEFASGRPVSPPIMPGWDGVPVRDHFADRYDVPVWVDNDVNVMALGEHQAGTAYGHRDFVYVKVGTGIGAGLVSGGRLHRGAQGCAGDIGHITVTPEQPVVCRCGKTGCLEALAGGAALARQGAAAAADGSSPFLAALLADGRTISSADVGAAAVHGDQVGLELLMGSARLVGQSIARIVNFFNPSLIVLGGGVVSTSDAYVAVVREVVYRQSLPLATRDLRITRSTLSQGPGPVGAAAMVVDELFSRERLASWLHAGTPSGRPELASLTGS